MSTEANYREAGLRPPRTSDAFPSDSWNRAQLREYADAHGIDLAGATLKADILAAVTAAPSPDIIDPALEASS